MLSASRTPSRKQQQQQQQLDKGTISLHQQLRAVRSPDTGKSVIAGPAIADMYDNVHPPSARLSIGSGLGISFSPGPSDNLHQSAITIDSPTAASPGDHELLDYEQLLTQTPLIPRSVRSMIMNTLLASSGAKGGTNNANGPGFGPTTAGRLSFGNLSLASEYMAYAGEEDQQRQDQPDETKDDPKAKLDAMLTSLLQTVKTTMMDKMKKVVEDTLIDVTAAFEQQHTQLAAAITELERENKLLRDLQLRMPNMNAAAPASPLAPASSGDSSAALPSRTLTARSSPLPHTPASRMSLGSASIGVGSFTDLPLEIDFISPPETSPSPESTVTAAEDSNSASSSPEMAGSTATAVTTSPTTLIDLTGASPTVVTTAAAAHQTLPSAQSTPKRSAREREVGASSSTPSNKHAPMCFGGAAEEMTSPPPVLPVAAKGALRRRSGGIARTTPADAGRGSLPWSAAGKNRAATPMRSAGGGSSMWSPFGLSTQLGSSVKQVVTAAAARGARAAVATAGAGVRSPLGNRTLTMNAAAPAASRRLSGTTGALAAVAKTNDVGGVTTTRSALQMNITGRGKALSKVTQAAAGAAGAVTTSKRPAKRTAVSKATASQAEKKRTEVAGQRRSARIAASSNKRATSATGLRRWR